MQPLSRYILLIVISCTSLSSLAQKVELPIYNHEIIYSDTVFVNNMPKKQLYDNANKWLLKKFPKQNATGFFKMDSLSGRIVANAQSSYYEHGIKGRSTNIVNYFVEIRVFDNAYGFRFYKFNAYNYELSQNTSKYQAAINFESDYKIYNASKFNPFVPRRIRQLDDTIREQIDDLMKTLGEGEE